MDFDPRDHADARERDDFEVYEVRWDGAPRDQDDRERDIDRARDPERPRSARAVCGRFGFAEDRRTRVRAGPA
jgi:hypothetical protein